MKKIKLLGVLVLIFALSGCRGSHDIKDVAIVMGMGISKGGGQYETTAQVVLPSGLSKNGEGDSFENYSGEGESLAKSIVNASSKCEKYMYMSHTTSLLISEEYAREGIYEALDYFMRSPSLSGNVSVAVAQGDINEVLKTETKLLKVPVSSVASLSRRLRETAFGKNITVSDFAEIAFGKSSACLVPLISAENGENTIEGSAVFKNGKMTEKISNKEVTGVLWLSGKTKNAVMAVPFEGKSFDIKIKNVKTKLNFEKNMVTANIKCGINVLRDNSGILPEVGKEKAAEIINQEIKRMIITSFDKMKKINADVYGFSEMIYKKDREKWLLLSSDGDVLQKITLDVKINTKIEDEGNILNSGGK